MSSVTEEAAQVAPDDAPQNGPFALALDTGTSSVRATLYDVEGREVETTEARVERGFCTTPDGGSEVDAETAIEDVARAVDQSLALAADLAKHIEAVGVACFWHSLAGTNEDGRAVTPVFGWADTRAADAADELRRRFDEQAWHARTGCRFHASYWPAKLLWLRKEHRDLYRKAARWMTFGELIGARFFGEIKTSVSMASGTGLFDVRACAWASDFLEELEISKEQLPLIAAPRQSFTKLTDEYARRWPRLRDAKWFPAIGDGAASNIGASCVTRERVALMIGTSGAMRALWQGAPPRALPPALWCYRADEKRIVVGGALSDGGGLYDWMNDALALSDDAEATERALAALEPDAHGLTVLPFWAGERSTGWSNNARGAITGLSMHTQPVEILRAGMEAVAYRFAGIARALDVFAPDAQVVASGGALLASPVWSQMIADVLGRAVKLSGVREASSRGAALLALEAVGRIKSIEDAPATFTHSYEPDMVRHARYGAGVKRQQKIYERLIAGQEMAGSINEAAEREPSENERRC